MVPKEIVVAIIGLITLMIIVITGVLFFYDQQKDTVPPFVKSLCTGMGEHEFATAEGYQAVFRGKAIEALRCNDGVLWKVREEGSLPESGIFFFDDSGIFLDLCQGLFRAEGCTRFVHAECDQNNYCNF